MGIVKYLKYFKEIKNRQIVSGISRKQSACCFCDQLITVRI